MKPIKSYIENLKVGIKKPKSLMAKKEIGTEVKILKATFKPFDMDEGGKRDYYWYKALRTEDGVTLNFGSTEKHEVDETLTLQFVKEERVGGKYLYKELVV